MRKIGSESGPLMPVSAHNLAKSKGPPPLARRCVHAMVSPEAATSEPGPSGP
jgi:hypothetical protein